MTLDEIRAARSDLEIQLQHAAATMELNNILREVRRKFLNIQEQCPHIEGEKNYSSEKKCPICGKKFGGN